MKNTLTKKYWIGIFLVMAATGYSIAQCTVFPKALAGPTLSCSGGTTYRSGVAYNPKFNLYYSVNSGSSSYSIETFDSAGKSLNSATQGFDFRGLWWNPTKDQLEGNGYYDKGIFVKNLSSSNGYPASSGTVKFTGQRQPGYHSCGQFNPNDSEIIYYASGNIYTYHWSNATPKDTIAITNLPVATSNLNETSIAYTGCYGMEVALYDYVNRRVYLVNLANGAYKATCQLPSAAPNPKHQRMSYANNLFWVFNESTRTWHSYRILKKCGSRNTISAMACESYVSPSGNHTWTSTGTYTDTLTNSSNCDSIITVNLSIRKSSSVITAMACESYVSPSGKHTWFKSGTYIDTILNSSNCDSVITIDLTINQSNSTIAPVACERYTSPSGMYSWTSSGIYADTIPNAVGCDSIISINLTIKNGTASSISPTSCNSYTSPSGNYVWTQSGTYTDTIPNSIGCDSVITVKLTIPTVNVAVTGNSATITANATGASYQWLDCNNGMNILAGETNQSFTATSSGDYAVEVTENGCVDTSVCTNVVIVSLEESEFANNIRLYPNPTGGRFFIDLGDFHSDVEVTITDMSKRVVQVNRYKWLRVINLDLATEAKGAYLVTVITEDKSAVLRLIRD